MKNKRRILSVLLLLCTLMTLFPAGAVSAFASTDANSAEEATDAMTDIKQNLATDSEGTVNYQIGETLSINDGGHVGALELSIFFDKEHFTVKSGYHGTPVILYTVNTRMERIGKDSDTEIIKSMLDRGYVVVVADYLNSAKAVSPALDNSAQVLRTRMLNGEFFTDSVFPGGYYRENHIVPAGYNILADQVFWEVDKHGVDGSLQEIVNNWNNDFRGTKGEKLVIWATGNTVDTRKTVLDGAVWYDASGKEDANGLYTKIKYTVATSIYDCVDPDGSMVDLDLYIHVVYPTVDETSKPVPVMSLANSSNYPTSSVTSGDPRAHSAGFLFNGYAQVVYDYLWFPMGRSASWGYYDGNLATSGAVTGDHMNYALHLYNDKLVNTAAMRYLRYLTLSQPDTYKFDTDAFGVYGNSKGGWMAFLGEAAVQTPLATGSYVTLKDKEEAIDLALSAFIPKRYLDGHHGETRYQVGDTATVSDPVTGFVIEGGELQPWMTYGGEEIISGAQLVYASNGSNDEDISAGHAPTIVASHLNDTYNAAYGTSNTFVNICRTLNIPSIFFEVPLGHTLVYGEDCNYGVDTYDAVFKFTGYYLKGDPVSVLYTTPLNRAAGVNVTERITVKFSGAVDASEIEKVTVSAGGNALTGVWSSRYGDTEWTFTPYSMKGGTAYTVTVPAGLSGKNGVAMGEAYTSSFITEYDDAESNAVSAVKGDRGTYFSFTAPTAFSENGNGYAVRFFVSNNAANIADIYAVDAGTFDPASPDGATVGALVGSVNLKGSGSYEIDVTDYVAERAGESIVLLLKAQETAGSTNIVYLDYSSGIGNTSKGSRVTAGV